MFRQFWSSSVHNNINTNFFKYHNKKIKNPEKKFIRNDGGNYKEQCGESFGLQNAVDLPAVYWWGFSWSRLLLCACWRHIRRIIIGWGAPPTSSGIIRETAELRDHHQPSEVCVWLGEGRVSGALGDCGGNSAITFAGSGDPRVPDAEDSQGSSSLLYDV